MSDHTDEVERTRQVIEALNKPANTVAEWWRYYFFWSINWDVVNLTNRKREMWKA